MANETIGDRIQHLCGGSNVPNDIPRWPPDCFAIAASLLMCSGAYSLVVDDEPIQGNPTKSDRRAKEIESIGMNWRRAATGDGKLPTELEQWWKIVKNAQDLPINIIPKHREVCLALLNLLAAADETAFDVGIFFPSASSVGNDDDFVSKAEMRLVETLDDDQGSTLCMAIHQSRGRVLPKMHTPQSGLTLRSLSHHLAYCAAPDVSPQWLSAAIDMDDHIFNLMVIPWPPVINPNQFKSSRTVHISDQVDSSSYGLFTYQATEGPSVEFVLRLIEDATRRIGRIDGIVLPELAISQSEFTKLSDAVGKERLFIAGVGTPATGSFKSGRNEAVIQVKVPFEKAEVYTQFHQQKHHRWKLTKSQILQYGIGQNLHPEVNWWEHILLEHRTLSFITLRPWLTTSVLICEDLCRPDPMGDILRAVGPNLIIALLCDAPQLIGRWPGRYAGAFADDPGSSVLTVTSAGMANLSQPQPGRSNRSRTVALWRDAKYGAQEIDLPSGADAILLNLTVEYHEEWTADGRPDGKSSGYPVLAAYHPIYATSNPLPTKRAGKKKKTGFRQGSVIKSAKAKR